MLILKSAISNFNGTITISVILAIVALVAPIVTSLINNKHLLKVKELEISKSDEREKNIYKNELFSEYLNELSMVLAMRKGSFAYTLDHEASYKASFLRCILIANIDTVELMKQIDSSIEKSEWDNAEKLAITVASYLSKELI